MIGTLLLAAALGAEPGCSALTSARHAADAGGAEALDAALDAWEAAPGPCGRRPLVVARELYDSGRASEAMRALEPAMGDLARSAEAARLYAVLLHRAGRHDEAVAAAVELRARRPRDAVALAIALRAGAIGGHAAELARIARDDAAVPHPADRACLDVVAAHVRSTEADPALEELCAGGSPEVVEATQVVQVWTAGAEAPLVAWLEAAGQRTSAALFAATQLWRSGDLAAAEVELNAALVEAPDHRLARLLRGSMYLEQADIELAWRDLFLALAGTAIREDLSSSLHPLEPPGWWLDQVLQRAEHAAAAVAWQLADRGEHDPWERWAARVEPQLPGPAWRIAEARIALDRDDPGTAWTAVRTALEAPVDPIAAQLAASLVYDPEVQSPPDVFDRIADSGEPTALITLAAAARRDQSWRACLDLAGSVPKASTVHAQAAVLAYACALDAGSVQRADALLHGIPEPYAPPPDLLLTHAELLLDLGRAVDGAELVTDACTSAHAPESRCVALRARTTTPP